MDLVTLSKQVLIAYARAYCRLECMWRNVLIMYVCPMSVDEYDKFNGPFILKSPSTFHDPTDSLLMLIKSFLLYLALSKVRQTKVHVF